MIRNARNTHAHTFLEDEPLQWKLNEKTSVLGILTGEELRPPNSRGRVDFLDEETMSIAWEDGYENNELDRFKRISNN